MNLTIHLYANHKHAMWALRDAADKAIPNGSVVTLSQMEICHGEGRYDRFMTLGSHHDMTRLMGYKAEKLVISNLVRADLAYEARLRLRPEVVERV